jgi:hypothetical protein
MSWDADAISRAAASLKAHGWDVTGEQVTTIRNGPLALHLGFFDVESTKGSSKFVIEAEGLKEVPGILKLSEVLPTTPQTSLQSNGKLHITTPALLWAYAAYDPLPFASTDRDKVWIRISAKVLSGQVGFGVLNGSEKAFHTRTTVGQSSGYSTLMLEVDHPEDARKLIIENDTPGGKKADVLISELGLFARPDSAIWKRLTTEPPRAEAPRDVPSATDSNKDVIKAEGLKEVSGILKLSAVLPTTPETSLQNKGSLHITTPALQYAYAAYDPLPFAPTDRDKVWIRISAKVLSGQVGFGVLNGSEKAFYTRTTVGQGAGDSVQILEVDHPEDARKLIIENDTPGGKKADVLISEISLFARPDSVIWKRLTSESLHPAAPRDAPSATDTSKDIIKADGLKEVSGILKLSAVLPTTPETSLENKAGLHITTPALQYAYAAYTPLPFASIDRDTVWIRISAKVLSGQVGFGVLNESEKAFLTRTTVGQSSGYSVQMLEIDHPEDARKLIIENDTPGGKKADVVISEISLFARPNSIIWKRLTSKSPRAQRQSDKPK